MNLALSSSHDLTNLINQPWRSVKCDFNEGGNNTFQLKYMESVNDFQLFSGLNLNAHK